MDRAARAQADPVRLARLGVRHQAIFRAIVLGQMPDDLANIRDAGRAQWMPLREQSARYVDGRFAAEARMHPAAFVDKLAGLAVAAKSEVLVMHQLRGREAVMQFAERDILRADSSLLVGLLRRAPSERADIGQREIAFSPGIRREHRVRDPRSLPAAGELLQLVLADEDRRRRAVSSPPTHLE